VDLQITINGEAKTFPHLPHETLLSVLRREGYYSVRFGSDTGETGAAAILLDGRLVNADIMLAAQAHGHEIQTVESLAQGINLHPIQEAFVRTGAIQSGYSTPATMLAAKALLEKNPHPTEAEVRDAISGILDRETGYVKPVQAILYAAAKLRGEDPEDVLPIVLDPITLVDEDFDSFSTEDEPPVTPPAEDGGLATSTLAPPKFIVSTEVPPTQVVGKPEIKVDALKLAKGNPAFVDDIEMRGMLYARLLTSPHAHARILDIDDSAALEIPGVKAVIHYKNIRVCAMHLADSRIQTPHRMTRSVLMIRCVMWATAWPRSPRKRLRVPRLLSSISTLPTRRSRRYSMRTKPSNRGHRSSTTKPIWKERTTPNAISAT